MRKVEIKKILFLEIYYFNKLEVFGKNFQFE